MSATECYRAVRSRDSRFDGVFFTAVVSTGIYCRPSCPAKTPLFANVRFYATSAAAQRAGFRACKRCRPGAAPGSPEWNTRSDVCARAMRLIDDGIVDVSGVSGLAQRLGYSERQLQRQLVAELGASPAAIARARRCEMARLLVETTDLAMSEVAFASGFSSIRQFNETFRSTYDRTPRELRHLRSRAVARDGSLNSITVQLPFRSPHDVDGLLSFLAERCVAGLETADDSSYQRVLTLPHGHGVISIARHQPTTRDATIAIELTLEDLRDLTSAVARCRRMLDLDADPIAIAEALGEDHLLGELVSTRPGMRLPGHVDAEELAVRAILGQQVSVAAARHLTELLVKRYGSPLPMPHGSLTHSFPSAETLASEEDLDLPMPGARRKTIVALAREVASGRLDLSTGADRTQIAIQLERIAGIGPWTSSYICMRGLSDPDVFLANDVGVRRALERLGALGDPKNAARYAQAWRPWRSYALIHLWGSHQSRSPEDHHTTNTIGAK